MMKIIMSDEFKGKAWLLAAALAGAYIGLSSSSETLTRKQQLTYVISGVATAFFLLPWGASYFGFRGEEALSALSFITGIYWKKIIVKGGELIDIIKLPWSKTP